MSLGKAQRRLVCFSCFTRERQVQGRLIRETSTKFHSYLHLVARGLIVGRQDQPWRRHRWFEPPPSSRQSTRLVWPKLWRVSHPLHLSQLHVLRFRLARTLVAVAIWRQKDRRVAGETKEYSVELVGVAHHPPLEVRTPGATAPCSMDRLLLRETMLERPRIC